MWQASYLIIVYATLGSICLEIVPKANVTSGMSNAARHFGRLVIGSSTKLISNKNKEGNSTNQQAVLEDTEGYQSDQPASTAWHKVVESKLRQLKPTVYCGGDAMTLHVEGSTMPNFMLDGGDGPVPLTQIPANCGLSVTQGPTDAVFNVHYQGCHVTQQADGHVLPLRLWGMPMKISCPLAPYALPTVSCLASGMVTKISCKSADVLKLKVNGKWEPFIPANSTCGITAESEMDGVVVTAPYESSCWQIKGGERFLSILYGNEELIFSCPDFQDPHLYGHVRIMSSQNHDPNVTSPSDSIMATNIATATTGLASNPEQPMSDLFSHMYYGHAWEIPAGTSAAPSVSSSPTTNAPSTFSTSKTVDMMYPLPEMYYPFSPMSNGKPMPQGYHWPFPAKAPTTVPATTVPTTKTTTTTSTTVASNPQQSAYSFNQMYYPFGPMLHHRNPMPQGYNWAFPVKAPTIAPATTVPTTKTTTTRSTTVASNPQQSAYSFNQMYYPFGPMLHHRNPMPQGYNWAFPVKAPTTAPATTVPTTKTTTTTSTSVASNPQQSAYFFNQMYYPYGPMHYHYKPIPYGYPWDFPAKVPTIVPTKTASTTETTTAATSATTPTIVASNPRQSSYAFNQMYYPYGPMPYHHKPMPFGYPWVFPAKPPTTSPTTTAPTIESATAPTTKTTPQSTATTLTTVANDTQQSVNTFNQMYSPFGSMHCHHRPSHHLGYPLTFPAKASTTAPNKPAPTTKTTFALTTKAATNATSTNPQQSAYPLNQMRHPVGSMLYPRKPVLHGYPLALPPKAHNTAPITKTATTATTPTIVASNLQQSAYPFNQVYSPFSPVHYQYKPTRLGSHFTSDLPA